MIYQGMLALLAMKTRLPIKYVMSREEDIVSTAKRHPTKTHYKMGLLNNGKITAVEIKNIIRWRCLWLFNRRSNEKSSYSWCRTVPH